MENTVVRPDIFKQFPRVFAGQSTRHGGVSPAPWASLNLGKSTDDSLENVVENRKRFAHSLGFEPKQMAWSKQVHGSDIWQVYQPGDAEGYDALISDQKNILLCVSVADCTPILVYDSKNQVIAAIHAGWKGTAAKLVGKTLQLMHHQFGTTGRDCSVYIGTCIDECSFEVGEEVAAQFDDIFKLYDPVRKKFFVDLKTANATQCWNFGIPVKQTEISPFCTFRHNHNFFSHRKEKGLTGRMMAAIGMQ